MAFTYPQKVLFKHCDPAGIVFYPRYFEMMNDCVEAFFGAVLAFPFPEIHKDGGVPTAAISTEFAAPSRHGDALCLRLSVTRMGRSSMGLRIVADCDGETRFETRSTLVLVDAAGRATPWPEPVREKAEACLEDSDDAA